MSLSAFLTGFLDKKADQITSRKAEGKRYFEDQAGRAREVSTKQLEARRERYRQLAQTGNILINTANMPEHVLRGLVSAGPEAVNTALELFQKVPTHEWSADDWENVYSTSQFYAEEFDEDLPTFMKRTVGLIGDNYKATEQTGGDLQSAFTASALGYNAKDKARRDLGELEVTPGYTASDLLAMESRPGWQSDMYSTYSGPVPSAFADIVGANTPVEPLSTQEQLRGWDTFNKMKEQAQTDLLGSVDGFDPFSPEGQAMIDQRAFSQFVGVIGPEEASKYNFVQNMLREQEAAQEATEAPSIDPAMSAPETPEMPVSEPPTASEGIPSAPPPPGSQAALTQEAQTFIPDNFGPRADRDRPYWDRDQGNAISRGVTAMRDALSGLFGRNMGEAPVSPPRSDQMQRGLNVLEGTPRESFTPQGREYDPGRSPSRPDMSPGRTPTPSIPSGWQPQDGGTLRTPDGRLVQPMGVDPNTLQWRYKDLQTGEEFLAPN